MAGMGVHHTNISWRRLNLIIEDEYTSNGWENFVLYGDNIGIYCSASNRLQVYNLLDKPTEDMVEAFDQLKTIASRNEKFPANMPIGIKSQAWSNKPEKRYGCNPKGSSRAWKSYERGQRQLARNMDKARRKVR